MTKLQTPITSNSLKIIDLYNKIDSGSLITRPNYQRNLVWKKHHKYAFIETILLNYPFPEIYIASAEVDVENLRASEVVVDGQQRLTTIVDYIKGRGDFENQNKIQTFDELSIDEKKEFLNYSVTVKDLKSIGEDLTKEIFKRINSTNYALNINEILNAEFGGGEFAYFAKQLVTRDDQFEVSADTTDVIINKVDREFIVDFFSKNNVFSENDAKRMFDAQFIMLIASTILEGTYFGRNSKVPYYLEKFNLEFPPYLNVLETLKKSIKIIDSLKMSPGSYWFNKPNLLTLIIELKDIEESELDLNKLELELSDLGYKYDLYFNGTEDDIKILSLDEIKYFEVAKQGSHELSSREHRGLFIKNIIAKSRIESRQDVDTRYEKNLKSLIDNKLDFARLSPTVTGLKKSIMDATLSVRIFLYQKDIHSYELQEFGPSHKVVKDVVYLDGEGKIAQKGEVSLYRSNGRGDYRIWFTYLKEFVEPNEELALIVYEGKLAILNITRFDYTNFINSIV